MSPQIAAYLSRIGRKGGKASRRHLSAADARNMARVRDARRAYRDHHTQCFWSFDPGYRVTLDDVPWVVEHLRSHGGREAWEKAARLCR